MTRKSAAGLWLKSLRFFVLFQFLTDVGAHLGFVANAALSITSLVTYNGSDFRSFNPDSLGEGERHRLRT